MFSRPEKRVSACGHLYNVMTHENVSEKVGAITRKLKRVANEFDAIAFRGMSGALVAPTVAYKLKKDIILVRKQEPGHSNHVVEGVKANRYVIVDDFIDDGDTVETIRKEVNDWHQDARLVGIALYNASSMCQMAELFLSKNKGVWLIHRESVTPMYPQVSSKRF